MAGALPAIALNLDPELGERRENAAILHSVRGSAIAPGTWLRFERCIVSKRFATLVVFAK